MGIFTKILLDKSVRGGNIILLSLLLTTAACSNYLLKDAQVCQRKGNYAQGKGEENRLFSKYDRMDLAMQQEIERTQDPTLGYVPRERLWKAQEYTQKLLKEGTRAAIPDFVWAERGPSNVAGRTRAILIDANDADKQTVFVGSVGGGIWKTTNITSSTPEWSEINPFFANLAITTLAQSPASPNILYAGTGEGWFNIDAIQGNGIFQSLDGGATWSQLAATNNSNFNFVQKIAIASNGTVYAATRSGLFKSTNNGGTWTKVLGSGVSGGVGDRVADVEITTNGDIFCSIGIFSTGKIYKSDASVNGANTGNIGTWTDISPVGTFQRIELAVAPSNGEVVYAICGNGSGIAGFYQTTNASATTPTWTSQAEPKMCESGTTKDITREGTSSQDWYDLMLAVNPSNANEVYAGGVNIAKSTNGGATWGEISVWGNACVSRPYVHADIHTMEFLNNTSSLVGCDGGVYYGTNMNTTDLAFEARNTGYNVTQFYACDLSPTAESNIFVAGAQDNGSNLYTNLGIGATREVTDGDGAYCHIDQDNASTMITSYVQQNYYISSNGGTSFSSFSTTGGDFINPTEYDDVANLLYACNTTDIYTRMTVPTGAFTNVTYTTGFGKPTSLKISPNTANRLFIGTNQGKVLKIDNAHTGTSVTATNLNTVAPIMPSGTVSSVAVQAGNDNHLLATFSNYGVGHVWECTNALAATPTWTNISGNLPDMPVRWVIFAPDNSDQAIIATELGVWTTTDLNGASTNWQPSNGGMANVRVDMLQYRASDGVIAAATHGRGLFVTNKYSAFNKMSFETSASSVSEAEATSGSSCLKYKDVKIPILLSKKPSADAVVTVSVNAASTATNNVDYTLLTPSITFKPTEDSVRKYAKIRIWNDKVVEVNKTLILDISESSADITGSYTTQHTLNLTNDDRSPEDALQADYSLNLGTANSNNSTPFRGTHSDVKIQYLILASELNALGIFGGNMQSLAVEVVSKGSSQPFNGFNIHLGTTSATTLNNSGSAAFLVPSDITNVYSGNVSTALGWNTFNFSTPFAWNGTDNLLVQFCFDNTTTSASDQISGVATAGRVCFNRSATGAGCSFANANIVANAFIPNLKFVVTYPAPIQTAVNPAVNEQYLGPNQTVHFYDNGGNIMATIQNLSAHDFGCTKVEVDRAGISTTPFWNNLPANSLTSKTFKVSPEFPANAPYNISLFYTKNEINAWATTTGRPISDFKLIKVSGGAISDVNAGNHASFSITENATNRTVYNRDHHKFDMNGVGFSGFAGGVVGSPLPVELITFTGELVDNDALLMWETASELNNAGFEIQRSNNGIGFHKVGFVEGNGTTQSLQRYHFMDKNLEAGQHFYRLRQLDIDGLEHFSDMIELTVGKAAFQFDISPNPVTEDFVRVHFTKPMPYHVKLHLYDFTHKLIAEKRFEKTMKLDYDLPFDRSALVKGNYFLTINYLDGTVIETKIVLIQ
ncbi:MAG: WD40/YVTN/BNR-like repeat-containing protein [Bacteroidia bacterium]